MTREDEDDLLQYVRSLGGLLILPATSTKFDFAPLDRFPEASQDEATRKFWLHYTGARIPLVSDYDPERERYVVDDFQSPVIEFWRSWTVSQIMLPGALQAELMYFDDEMHDLSKKPVEFRKWFEMIDDWIQKKYQELGIHIFAGPGAQRFRDEGGILQGR